MMLFIIPEFCTNISVPVIFCQPARSATALQAGKHGVQVISCTTFPFNPTGYEGVPQKRWCSPEKTVA